ncbi:MAG TPA: SH3 domain-containing protein [Geminicoccaceae bacterium]|nr:SH3 domain-containing protein [Geminicoccaceae bacterium]
MLALLWLLTALPALAEQRVGPSGLLLPRFVALAETEVNVRTGPGRQYPIRFVLTRRDLPVKIVDEFDTWRKIEDHESDEGWVHSSLLSSKRSALVVGQIQELRRTPDPEARVVLRLEPGVVGSLLGCQRGWCQLEIQKRRGWLRGDAVWGVLPEEAGG